MSVHPDPSPRPRAPRHRRGTTVALAALTAVALLGAPAAATAAPAPADPAPSSTAAPTPSVATTPAATPAAEPGQALKDRATPGALPVPDAPTRVVSPRVLRQEAAAQPAGASAPTAATTAAVPATATAPADLRAVPGTLLGEYVVRGEQPSVEAATQATEDALGRRLDTQRLYHRWDENLLGPIATGTVQRARVPMLSILPRLGNGSVVRWATIASGGADAQIRTHAQQVKQLGPTVYLTLHHEPDIAGTSFGTPAEYVAAWRHYVEVFRAEGVTNVLWTWVSTTGALTQPTTDPTAKGFYPGDDVVDRIGSDTYNWFGCRAGSTTGWRSLEQVTAGLRTFAANHGKPAVLAEWGSVEDPAQPDRRAAWMREAFAYIASWPELEAVAYFDTVGTCDWRLGDGAAAAAYREAAVRPEMRTRPAAWLELSRTQGAGTLTVELSGARSSGALSATGAGVTSWTLDLGDGTTRSGTGQPPAALGHTYGVGTFTPTLRVTDARGLTAVDARTVTVAAAPAVTGVAERNVTITAADLFAWVDTKGVAGTVTFEWRAGTTVVGTATAAATAKSGPQELSTTKPRNLTPGTKYTWTVTVTTGAGSASREDGWMTPGPPTVRDVAPASVGSTSAVLKLRVTPNGVATNAWIEWGTTTTDQRTPTLALGAVQYERGEQQTVSGLKPRTTYRFRVVAENSYGRTVGPVQTFTTRS
ncbi:glycosyl hydrolase [Cellulomonas sp. 179-A 9B4 NHS]|uniref:glycosyl hydrolase n=1 Tax=Cellulomonas sp. 179-A 9B4 NHS TaxID=3142379 RepID=UPI0039A1600F